MRKRFILIVAILSGIVCGAFGQSAKGSSEKKSEQDDWALLFNFENLVAAISPYNDGFQTGAGVKHWFKDTLGARALLYVLMEPDGDEKTTTLGCSAALEFHPRPGRVSPYVGGILGSKFLFEPDQNYIDFFLGGIGGIEVRLFQNFALYAEYQAILVRDYDGLWFKFGNDAALGFAIYF